MTEPGHLPPSQLKAANWTGRPVPNNSVRAYAILKNYHIFSNLNCKNSTWQSVGFVCRDKMKMLGGIVPEMVTATCNGTWLTPTAWPQCTTSERANSN
jgi:hypothetical protein